MTKREDKMPRWVLGASSGIAVSLGLVIAAYNAGPDASSGAFFADFIVGFLIYFTVLYLIMAAVANVMSRRVHQEPVPAANNETLAAAADPAGGGARRQETPEIQRPSNASPRSGHSPPQTQGLRQPVSRPAAHEQATMDGNPGLPEDVERLTDLHRAGHLTEAEYRTLVQRALDVSP